MKRALVASFAVVLVLLAVSSPLLAAEVQARFVTGKVLDSGDRGVPKAIVYLKNTKTLVIKTYIADQDGAYRFPGLSPNADYELYAESDGKRSDKKAVSSFETRTRLTINLRIDK